jgi:hypothetical protein
MDALLKPSVLNRTLRWAAVALGVCFIPIGILIFFFEAAGGSDWRRLAKSLGIVGFGAMFLTYGITGRSRFSS